MGRLVAILFGGAFAAVGLFVSGMAANDIWGWAQSSAWVSTPAEIDTLQLKTSHGDSTTYCVEATYHYNFQGKKYNGDRPSLYSISDNIGSFHENLYARLRADQRADRVTCLVNPQDPTQSLLDRTARPGMLGFQMIFIIAFGSIGLSIAAYGISSRPAREVDDGLQIDSSHRSSRFVSKVMILYHGLVMMVVLPTALLWLLVGELSALLPLMLAGASIAIVYFAFRYVFFKQPIAGKLRLPHPGSATSRPRDFATLLLPASWQGPVDLETRWTIPAQPSNRLGVEDDEGDATHVEAPAVGGTTHVTEVELPMPELPTGINKSQPIELEVIGTIGGYRYHDEFSLQDKALRWLHSNVGQVDGAGL